MSLDPFVESALFIDIELDGRSRISHIAAMRGGEPALRCTTPLTQADRSTLNTLATGAACVVGHNQLFHDLPYLRQEFPKLALHSLPVVDTLVLSPLVWPGRPFHRLIKPYKIVLSVENDPLADCIGCKEVLSDALQALSTEHGASLAFLRHALATTDDQDGFGLMLDHLDGSRISLAQALEGLRIRLVDRMCSTAWRVVEQRALNDLHTLMPLAYAARWMDVAGAGTDHGAVLPAWVRHRYPDTSKLLHELRGVDCGRPDCRWCARVHNPEHLLQVHWGYPGFRAKPATLGGGSLQRAVVEHGLHGKPTFAAMPTGGGKSIGFQLPALARYAARGTLTVVVSPLQSLMQDQVQGLRKQTNTECAATLNGMLTPVERTDVLERVRDGRVGLLYLSPEQTRNRTVRSALVVREIGAWVFDEAHCLSTWGHDFRTDYRYVLRFLAELAVLQGSAPPPVFCTTATAQLAVIDEICALVKHHTGQDLQRLLSTSERDNLDYEVQNALPQRRLQAIGQALEDALGEARGTALPGSAIVFGRTRRSVEERAEELTHLGWRAAAFHAGLEQAEKRKRQDAFMAGEIRVMCATSAFGMGIDKEDVRLVVHDYLPGSLESYLQQSGRAGRDRKPARCLLLFENSDTEAQFRMAADGELRQRDISALLRVVRNLSSEGTRSPTVVSHGELKRLCRARPFMPDEHQATTQLSAAVSWLERAKLLRRDENSTRVFQGRLKHTSLQKSFEALDALNLKPAVRTSWRTIISALAEREAPRSYDADDLADLANVVAERVRPRDGRRDARFAGLALLRHLYEMVRAGLLTKGVELSAWVTMRRKGSSELRLNRLVELEEGLHRWVESNSTELEAGSEAEFSLREVNTALLQAGQEHSETAFIKALFRAMAGDGRRQGDARGASLDLRTIGRSRLRIKLYRPWPQVQALAGKRHRVARLLLGYLTAQVEKKEPNAAGRLLVEFSLDALVDHVRSDMQVRSELVQGKEIVAVERALLYMHELEILRLDRGLAIFRPAMTLRFDPIPERWQYTTEHHQALAQHYRSRTLQIHVMDIWARRALVDMEGAKQLARDWFQLDRRAFLARWMPDYADKDLERRTTAESHARIVTDLRDPSQQAIVTWKGSRALLVLAGPGSGKTRAIVHRCAWLVRHERVPFGSVLVLCYNRSTALEVRARLRGLLGADARRVDVFTYHGLALRLVGTVVRGGELDFSELLREAAEMLSSDGPLSGTDPRRDRILAGYEHILVDEYQDIDAQQYELVSLIAGRSEKMRGKGPRLRLMAVGDDDQNIYDFRKTSTVYIRRFEADYNAKTRHLLQNYRSTRYILDAAQGLIRHDPNRLKQGQELVVDRRREKTPPGGRMERSTEFQGRVRVLTAPDVRSQLLFLQAEVVRLLERDSDALHSDVAILARTRKVLNWVRIALEAADIPHVPPTDREALPNPSRLRSVAELLESLRPSPQRPIQPKQLRDLVAAWPPSPDRSIVLPELEDILASTEGAVQTAGAITERLVDAISQARSGMPIGEGVRLSTLHGVKGLEFKHVIVFDGDWKLRGPEERAAERRLLYVGMTRARDTLTILSQAGESCPLLEEVDHPDVLRADVVAGSEGYLPPAVRFEMVGMSDLYLDWAGTKPSHHSVHPALDGLQVGQRVRLLAMDGGVHVVGPGRRSLAKLSRAGTQKWEGRLQRIIEARVTSVVRRYAEDSREGFRERVQVARWLVPLVEVRWR